MPYIVNFYRASGIQKIYFNAVGTPVPTDIWAATWYPTDETVTLPSNLAAEDYGDVNKYTYVKPMLHIFDCTDPNSFETSTATEFINGTNCGIPNTRINALIDKLKQLPEGKRTYRTTRYDRATLYNHVNDRFANGEQSPWAENVGISLSNDIATLFGRFGICGATPDYIAIDSEQRQLAFQYQPLTNHSGTTLDILQLYGITSDVKYNQTWYGLSAFADLYKNDITGQTYTFDNIVSGTYHPQNERQYLYYNRAMTGLLSALIDKFISDPIKAVFPSVKVSNYKCSIITDGGTFGNAYDHNGHPEMHVKLVGDGASPEMYAGWGFPNSYGIYEADPTRIVRTDYAGSGITAFPGSSWNHFLILMQNMRTAVRDNPNTPIRPWVSSPYFTAWGAQWTDNSENLGLYYESIRHIALMNTEIFLYFNSDENTSGRLTTALPKLNSVIQEVNTIKGGYQPNKCVTTDRINFLTDYIISGAGTTKETYIWRVTPKPGIMLEHPDGTILDLDSDGGAWVQTETSSVPTFYNTLNAPYEIVFKYLMNKYEPEWGANLSTEGKTARIDALGVSASYNPFGTTGGTAYQYIAYTPLVGASAGYFDPLSHPRLYAKAIQGCGYRKMQRARGHTAAKHRFVDDWNLPGTIGDVYYDRGGNQNTFFGFAPRYKLYPAGGETTDNLDDYRRENSKALHFNFQLNLDNKIERYYIHSPYGKMAAGMAHDSYLIDSGFSSRLDENITLPSSIRSMPWISNRYTAESFLWDMYLYLKEETTLRDFTLDPYSTRLPSNNTDTLNAQFTGRGAFSVEDLSTVGYTYDIHLNTQYSGFTFPQGQFGKTLTYNSQKDRPGGITKEVNIGSPWIKFTAGFYWDIASGQTKFQWFGSAPLGLCFDKRTLVMFDGSTWGLTPPTLDTNFQPLLDAGYNNFFADYGTSSLVGFSFGYGQQIIDSWNRISTNWGSQIEFIGYMGTLPYGLGPTETYMPYMMYRNPTIQSNVDYFKWRLDAAISHWKWKFKSPHDGFSRIIFENGGTQRTYHQYEGPGYTKYTNVLSPGVSFVDNIITSWCRDQYNYTFGRSGPNADKGIIVGTETFAYYSFLWDGWVVDPNNTEFSKFPNDQQPWHWGLDQDIATDMLTSAFYIGLGQRKYGFTYADSLWKKGACGTSEIGEVFAYEKPYWNFSSTTRDAHPYFHNTFIEYVGGPNPSSLQWKTVPGTKFGQYLVDAPTSGGVPWLFDRRFRLFFLYPFCLNLNMSIVDTFHSGSGYYNITVEPRPLSGWFDITLGKTYFSDMDYSFFGTHSSNLTISNTPYANRKNPVKPPQNNWIAQDIDNSEFELLYSCMKAGLTGELDSLGYSDIYAELQSRGSTGFPKSLFV